MSPKPLFSVQTFRHPVFRFLGLALALLQGSPMVRGHSDCPMAEIAARVNLPNGGNASHLGHPSHAAHGGHHHGHSSRAPADAECRCVGDCAGCQGIALAAPAEFATERSTGVRRVESPVHDQTIAVDKPDRLLPFATAPPFVPSRSA